LENATVRASAVSALAKFGVVVESLRPRILVLLRRCLFDTDDEVRDRATLYLNLLGNGPENVSESAQSLIFERLDVPLANLEASLQSYEPSERPFDVAAVSTEVKPQPFTEKKAPTSKKAGKDTNQKVTANGGGLPGHKTSDSYERLLNSIPEFAGFGKLFKVQYHNENQHLFAMQLVKFSFEVFLKFSLALNGFNSRLFLAQQSKFCYMWC
jgi:coatomer protein complex subunit gamma